MCEGLASTGVTSALRVARYRYDSRRQDIASPGQTAPSMSARHAIPGGAALTGHCRLVSATHHSPNGALNLAARTAASRLAARTVQFFPRWSLSARRSDGADSFGAPLCARSCRWSRGSMTLVPRVVRGQPRGTRPKISLRWGAGGAGAGRVPALSPSVRGASTSL